jgi:hypothetical protein
MIYSQLILLFFIYRKKRLAMLLCIPYIAPVNRSDSSSVVQSAFLAVGEHQSRLFSWPDYAVRVFFCAARTPPGFAMIRFEGSV